MGIGEAAVTLLSERGVPTPVVHTRMVAPASRMGPADDIDGAARASSAVGALRRAQRRAERAGDPRGPAGGAASPSRSPGRRACPRPGGGARPGARRHPSGGADAIGDFLRSREGKALQRKVARGVFGMLRKHL